MCIRDRLEGLVQHIHQHTAGGVGLLGIAGVQAGLCDLDEPVTVAVSYTHLMRTEMNVHPAKKTSMIIETADAAPFQKAQVSLAKFAFDTDVTFTEKYEGSTCLLYTSLFHFGQLFSQRIDAGMHMAAVQFQLGLTGTAAVVHACAGRFRGRGIEYDDLYSACLLYTSRCV